MTQNNHRLAFRAIAKPVLIIVMIIAMDAPAIACPMCKDSCPISSTTKVAPVEPAGLDFNNSIYFMLGGLLTAIGVASRVMYKAASGSRI